MPFFSHLRLFRPLFRPSGNAFVDRIDKAWADLAFNHGWKSPRQAEIMANFLRQRGLMGEFLDHAKQVASEENALALAKRRAEEGRHHGLPIAF